MERMRNASELIPLYLIQCSSGETKDKTQNSHMNVHGLQDTTEIRTEIQTKLFRLGPAGIIK